MALSADLRSSRQAAGRSELADQIEATLAVVNAAFAEYWLAPLESTRGLDELSGVLNCRAPVFDILLALNVPLWPQSFRFGVADGRLDVVGEAAGDMDGPAFHRAADALDRARADNLPLALDFERTSRVSLDLAEAAAQLHLALVDAWTASTARVANLLRPPGREPITQAEVASKLGKSQQSVSAAYRRGHLRELTNTKARLSAWLAEQDRP